MVQGTATVGIGPDKRAVLKRSKSLLAEPVNERRVRSASDAFFPFKDGLEQAQMQVRRPLCNPEAPFETRKSLTKQCEGIAMLFTVIVYSGTEPRTARKRSRCRRDAPADPPNANHRHDGDGGLAKSRVTEEGDVPH